MSAWTTGTVVARDGVALATHRWPGAADGASRGATVLVVHGYAEHVRRYDALATDLHGAGFDVIGFDLRGHGASGGRRADVEDFDIYVDDVAAVAEAVAADAPDLAVLGHSMGGAIAARFAQRGTHDLSALVLASPYLINAVPVPPWLEPLARLLQRIVPQLGVRELDTEGLSRLPEEVRAYETDPLIYNGLVKARMGVQLVDGGRRVLEGAAPLDVPTLVLHGEADRIADPEGSRRFAERTGSELRTYPGGFHELFFDRVRAEVRRDVVAWLEGRLT